MKLRKSDVMLILSLLLAAGLMWFFLRPGETGAYAVVTQNGSEIRRLDLSQEQTVTISSHTGGWNTLVVSSGSIHISDATCGDHTCVRTGRISRTGQQIICLPHNLVIEIIGGDAPELDASTH